MGDIVGADHDEASHSQVPETSAPYCMVDRDLPAYLTVAGPADGRITVNGVSAGTLVLVDAIDYGPEVAPDAGPYDGILYNVEGPGTVRVDGQVCETT
jgi:hypothetical protein